MPSKTKRFCVAEWLPSDTETFRKWLHKAITTIKVDYKDELEKLMELNPSLGVNKAIMDAKQFGLHELIQELLIAILSEPKTNMLFHQMFSQQADLMKPGVLRIPCWQLALLLINNQMRNAPMFHKEAYVMVPLSVILNLAMDTPAGYAAFLDERFNRIFKKILNYWGEFLKTKDSCKVLNNDPVHGWFGEYALEAMPNFIETYECNPTAPSYGFTSWDDFFTRKFRPGIRPVESPDDNAVVVSACEASPVQIYRNVQKGNQFWVKAQRYSIDVMLNMNRLAEEFVGGTIFQAFLTSTSYHRFHSPVTGVVCDTEILDGFYFAKKYCTTERIRMRDCQDYLAHMSARAIVYIQADNPDIGLMAFIPIGMTEVSTTELTVSKGDSVKKGDDIGAFHFGGSTYLLVFRPGVNIEFDLRGQTPSINSEIIKVNSKIAIILPSKDN